jgi:hypothetical protein
MGWFEILLILLFIVFPLLEQVASARRKKGQQPDELPPEYDGTGHDWTPEPRVEPRRERRVEPEGDGSWSEGWGAWPGAEPAEPEPVATKPRRAEPEHGFHWEQSRQRAEPEPPAPTPERRPMRREPVVLAPPVRVAAAERVAVGRERGQQRSADQSARRSSEPARVRRPPASSISRALHQPDDLRRAIILTEVLGQPRALRPLDDGTRH